VVAAAPVAMRLTLRHRTVKRAAPKLEVLNINTLKLSTWFIGILAKRR
jgi:hypothetical protein